MTSEAQLRMWFEQIDLDRNGLLSVREVQKCLALNNLTFSLTSTNMLMRLFDADHSGMLSFNQFVVLHGFLTKFNTIYDASCAEKGAMTIPELRGVLQREGIMLEDTAFFAICESFDPDRNGKFANPEFIALIGFVQSCQAAFNAFDANKSGTINLNLGQFLYACSKTR